MKAKLLRWGLLLCCAGFLLFGLGLYFGRTTGGTVLYQRPAAASSVAAEAPEAPEAPETPEAPEEPDAPEETATEPEGMASRVNLNTADAAALESLPGIGPALAQRIIDYRMANGPFQTTAEIQDVRGIGAGIYEKIKDSITVE
ncbi:MAG: ComEA family DNA-binding protein [Oscillospiraceae bacterium]|nr:ComEA family DNA-binding protein [Oscillospiraceae bacterium]